MDTVIVIFAFGVAVSLVVAKGMMQARDFARGEQEKLEMQKRINSAEKLTSAQ